LTKKKIYNILWIHFLNTKQNEDTAMTKILNYGIIILLTFFLSNLFLISEKPSSLYFDSKFNESNKEQAKYKRVIESNEGKSRNLIQVRDYYTSGKIQMQGTFKYLNPKIKISSYWFRNLGNVRHGNFTYWYENGQKKWEGSYKNNLLHGPAKKWYESGQIQSICSYKEVREHGKSVYLQKNGEIRFQATFKDGTNLTPEKVNYQYLLYKPSQYEHQPNKKWPLIIFLHGGSIRGSNLHKLYDAGIPDQIYRKREFPFIIASPLCPLEKRWSTDDWFESFFDELVKKYRIDENRVYLTGLSLGGSGTWYLAVKYPEKFAAIAPMCGKTNHLKYLYDNIKNIKNIPTWVFHGETDKIVLLKESQDMVNALRKSGGQPTFTIFPKIGHGAFWKVYPGQELYDWFLSHSRSNK
jgi:antitoxin component YwqK of YwqJK toxin-antitoxin module/pimeloyl-ACP methyl ester carboxylesterase